MIFKNKIVFCDIDKNFAKYLLKKFLKLKINKKVNIVIEMLDIIINNEKYINYNGISEDIYKDIIKCNKKIKKGLNILTKHYEEFWNEKVYNNLKNFLIEKNKGNYD